jgi:DNA polymerase-1
MQNDKPISYLLVDGNNLLMRAIYATLQSGMEVGGINTGGLLVFINTLTKHIRETKATHVGVAWDMVGGSHRRSIDSQYKVNRQLGPTAQQKKLIFPLVKEFCTLAGITQYELEGWEADDIVAGWWADTWHELTDNKATDPVIIILSSDKDFLQLLGDNPHGLRTVQLRLSSFQTDTDMWTATRVQEIYGCQPRQLPMMMAFMGDLADNVTGIRGIGPKKAKKLLETHNWDFHRTVDSLLVADDQDRVRRNLSLVNLREVRFEQTPSETLHFIPPNEGTPRYQRLMSFCTAWQLESVVHRLPTALWENSEPTKSLPGKHFEVPTTSASPLP